MILQMVPTEKIEFRLQYLTMPSGQNKCPYIAVSLRRQQYHDRGAYGLTVGSVYPCIAEQGHTKYPGEYFFYKDHDLRSFLKHLCAQGVSCH
jgi:hypothetical protein